MPDDISSPYKWGRYGVESADLKAWQEMHIRGDPNLSPDSEPRGSLRTAVIKTLDQLRAQIELIEYQWGTYDRYLDDPELPANAQLLAKQGSVRERYRREGMKLSLAIMERRLLPALSPLSQAEIEETPDEGQA